MVSHPGTSPRPHRIRALNTPRPINVAVVDGLPVRITIEKSSQRVEKVQDTWIVEDEWWRQPIDRHYFALLLDNGVLLTVFHDRVADTWFAQAY